MLEIRHITKTYRTGELVQHALDDVSLVLRDNEFVAVLGPSGSGKTTLLNLIGGLDHCDGGELVINGVSTKQYRSRDWDVYRNHSVGFVFQSYNLIPHQTVLSNVELALTISGVVRAERRRRATEALKKVGLGDQLHKRPNQLSGGQMQRVAIARALVNDPAILLADEPTGALDSETSLQVMDLLREVARDRLVVMVTHNPELAEAYATRIVRLRDGKIVDDSAPCPAESRTEAVHRSPGRASMSFRTALSLSFQNLRTKRARTLLTAFAGSIGIIGIALILSMSNGVDRYIQSVEEDTLKSYPLQLTDSTFDLSSMYDSTARLAEASDDAEVTERKTITSLLSGVNANDLQSLRRYFEEEDRSIYRYVQAIEYDYGVTPHVYSLDGETLRQVNPDTSFAAMGIQTTENTGSLFSAFSSTDSFHPMPEESALYMDQYELKAGHWPEQADECIVVLTANGRIPDMALYALGLKDPAELEAMVNAFVVGESTETDDTEAAFRYADFLGIEFRLIHSADCYTYDESYGVWTDRSADSDYMLALAEQAERLTVVGVVQPKDAGASGCLRVGICYPSALSHQIIVHAAQSEVVAAQLQTPEINVFTGQPFGDAGTSTALSVDKLFSVDEAALAEVFDFDEDALLSDFSVPDLSGLDLSSIRLDPAAFAVQLPSLSAKELSSLLDGVSLDLSEEQLQTLFETLLQGYLRYAQSDPSTDYGALPDAMLQFLRSDAAAAVLRDAFYAQLAEAGANVVTAEQLLGVVEAVSAGYPAYLEANGLSQEEAGYAYFTQYLQSDVAQAILSQSAAALQAQLADILPSSEDLSSLAEGLFAAYLDYAAENALPDPSRLGGSFADYLKTDEAQALLRDAVAGAVDTSQLEQRFSSMLNGLAGSVSAQLSGAMTKAVAALGDQLSTVLQERMAGLAEQLSDDLRAAFTLDPDAMAELFTANMSMEQLRDLVSSLLSGEGSSYRGNLRKLGYADEADPQSITIYPSDFQSKNACKAILADYNERMRANGEEDKVIVYTDMVETLMRSVTEIIDAISIVLIAFVAVSLVVSSIMIGIITYISVLERTKEIGILRAIGASKRNVSNVFNAETFLIGLCAGLLGIGITLLLLIPINLLITHLTGINDVKAVLPFGGAVILVLLSMALTLLAGLIPSRKAARKDPVAALRTE